MKESDSEGGIYISTYTKQSLSIVIIILAALISFPLAELHYGNRLSLSRASGYYDSAFYLDIRGGGKKTIHYTLDGSEPTADDPVFNRDAPLYIEDATNRPNVYSARKDTSTAFRKDLIAQYEMSDPNYTVPDYPVDKATVVRASLFDSDGKCLDSVTGTYFVGFQGRDAYQGIYTASVVTSPENLFDADTGIYVTGDVFARFLNSELGQGERMDVPAWNDWDANYFGRGLDWEREANLTVFDDHQNIVLSQQCGIRIKGGGSRGFLPKSIGCYAREIYAGSNEFDVDLFKTNIFPHKIVLFSGGDDNSFKLKDYLANVMERELHFATMDFIPCAMFLNGEYWGMYYITEDYNADYIRDHYSVAGDNIILMKNDELAEDSVEDYEKWLDMRDFIANYNMAEADNYSKACGYIDIDSYLDYYAAQIYIARVGDWPRGNYAAWRSRNNDGSRYGDCKWRWMLFDVNSSGSMELNIVSDDTLSAVLAADPVFCSLYQSEEFRRRFAERILYIGKEIFAPEKCNQFLDQYEQMLREPIAAGNRRFYNDTRYEEFDRNVTDMRTFFEQRYDVVWNFLVENMGEEWLSQNGIQK